MIDISANARKQAKNTRKRLENKTAPHPANVPFVPSQIQ